MVRAFGLIYELVPVLIITEPCDLREVSRNGMSFAPIYVGSSS